MMNREEIKKRIEQAIEEARENYWQGIGEGKAVFRSRPVRVSISYANGEVGSGMIDFGAVVKCIVEPKKIVSFHPLLLRKEIDIDPDDPDDPYLIYYEYGEGGYYDETVEFFELDEIDRAVERVYRYLNE